MRGKLIGVLGVVLGVLGVAFGGAALRRSNPESTPSPDNTSAPATRSDDTTSLQPRARAAAGERGRLSIDGSVFHDETGAIWQYRGFSDFLLYQKFLTGSDLGPILEERAALGANVVRVLGMVTSFSHFHPQEHANYYNQLPAFAARLGEYGLRVEFVVFADAQIIMPVRSDQERHIDLVVEKLASSWNVLVEVCNEPFKNIPGGEQTAFELGQRVRGRGLLIASGAYADSPASRTLDYGTTHTARDEEWPRRAKDILDLRDATKVPWVADEPIGANEVDRPGSRASSPDEFAWYGAAAALMGTGATFHSDSGVRSAPLDPTESACARAFFFAIRWVPAEAQTWPYQRGDAGSEAGIGNMPILHNDSSELRSYCKSRGAEAYCVQVRTKREHATPRDGWKIKSEPRRGFVALTR